MDRDELITTFVEVTLPSKEFFLKVKETLTRIGLATVIDGTQTLFQSCHILHKKGKYYIVHFKELFALDGRCDSITREDLARRNRVACLLEEWGLVNIVKDDFPPEDDPENVPVKIVKFSERQNWNLVPKYSIGKNLGIPSKTKNVIDTTESASE